MDAFFAAIEQRDNPDLQGKPIAVGGKPEQRGVVATASYEARAFGIHSAMPMATAVRLCPQLLIVPSRIRHYRTIAEQIRGIFSRFTPLIEPLSIDEAYLDVSDNTDFHGSATLLAEHIIATISHETQLTASAGVSYCKFLAKYASTVNKPNGVFTVTPQQAGQIIDAMPVEKFHGIGPATQKKLNALGITNGLQLRQADIIALRQQLGKNADFYVGLAKGKDERPIRTHRVRKSIGTETTFARDLTTLSAMQTALQPLLKDAWQSLQKHDLFAGCITLKIKYHDFTQQTKSHTQSTPITRLTTAQRIASALLSQANPTKSVRLLGISFSQLHPQKDSIIQHQLFD